MKKYVGTLILCIASILYLNFDVNAKRRRCDIASILEAAAGRSACIEGCGGNGYCEGYCDFYFDLVIERSLC